MSLTYEDNIYCQGKANDEIKYLSRKMAEAVNVDYIVESQSDKGGAYNYAGSIGLPGILLERGCMGKWSKEEVEADKKDVESVLYVLGVLDKEILLENNNAKFITNTIYENSKYTGCWYLNYKSGNFFKKGNMCSNTSVTGADISIADYYWISTNMKPAEQ